MKAEELRIGNLVKQSIPLSGSIIEKCLYDNGILKVNKNFIFYNIEEYCIGIPITGEWINKFKYKKTTYFDFILFGNDFCLRVYYQGSWNCMLPHIKFVHQLQNLYFALTGEELILKK